MPTPSATLPSRPTNQTCGISFPHRSQPRCGMRACLRCAPVVREQPVENVSSCNALGVTKCWRSPRLARMRIVARMTLWLILFGSHRSPCPCAPRGHRAAQSVFMILPFFSKASVRLFDQPDARFASKARAADQHRTRFHRVYAGFHGSALMSRPEVIQSALPYRTTDLPIHASDIGAHVSSPPQAFPTLGILS